MFPLPDSPEFKCAVEAIARDLQEKYIRAAGKRRPHELERPMQPICSYSIPEYFLGQRYYPLETIKENAPEICAKLRELMPNFTFSSVIEAGDRTGRKSVVITATEEQPMAKLPQPYPWFTRAPATATEIGRDHKLQAQIEYSMRRPADESNHYPAPPRRAPTIPAPYREDSRLRTDDILGCEEIKIERLTTCGAPLCLNRLTRSASALKVTREQYRPSLPGSRQEYIYCLDCASKFDIWELPAGLHNQNTFWLTAEKIKNQYNNQIRLKDPCITCSFSLPLPAEFKDIPHLGRYSLIFTYLLRRDLQEAGFEDLLLYLDPIKKIITVTRPGNSAWDYLAQPD